MNTLAFTLGEHRAQLTLKISTYPNGNLAIKLYEKDHGILILWETLTTNLTGIRPDHCAFINIKAADGLFPAWLSDNHLAEPTGQILESDGCLYPEYLFYGKELDALDHEGHTLYIRHQKGELGCHFERLYIADPATHEEVKDPYYTWYNEEAACRRILAEFGLPGTSHIVNGHVAVREKSGESPIKGGGRLVVIDGGFCRAYHEKTGIAGYTLVYSSRTMSLRTHQPFVSAEKAVNENIDIVSQKNILETENHRILVEETDEGENLRERVHDLKQLVKAYQLGWIKETCSEDCVW